jgi:hypothetical protein
MVLRWVPWLLSWFVAVGCGPRLSDRPEEFIGTDVVAVAMICSSDEAERDEPGDLWIKAVIRAGPGVEVDWPGIKVRARNSVVVRQATGRVTKNRDGSTQRINTYWLTATGDQAEGRAGPLLVPYIVRDGRPAIFESQGCPFLIR